MKLQPLGDRIIVKPLEAEEKTKGGIVLPEAAKEKPQQGKVLAAGNGKVKEDGTIRPLELKKGDLVLYGKYSGTEITTPEGEDVLIMREEDVFAVVK